MNWFAHVKWGIYDVNNMFICIDPYSEEFAAAWMNLGIVKATLNKTEVCKHHSNCVVHKMYYFYTIGS